MVNLVTFRQLALSFSDVREEPHFEKPSFRIGKKIFATYDAKNNRACFKLSETDQDVFGTFDNTIIYPVPNKWGKQGWTLVDMKQVPKKLFYEMLSAAYAEVAKKK